MSDASMSGLFQNQHEAYEAGKNTGREHFYEVALRRLSELSVEYEKAGNVEAFKAVEMACGTLRSAKVIADKRASGIRDN